MTYKRKDGFYTRAKAAGFRSRAAYKLIDLARRYRLIAAGDHVVDLGAWPGGWLQVAAQLVGPRGMVAGVDRQPIDPVPGARVSCIQGDAGEPEVQEEVLRCLAGRVDVVLSDMFPKLTGVRARDTANADELARIALDIAARMLKPGGRLLIKVFVSPETDRLLDAARRWFSAVKLTRPAATRKGSAELYLVARGRRPRQAD